jgi:hypothetical protein
MDAPRGGYEFCQDLTGNSGVVGKGKWENNEESGFWNMFFMKNN